jgi:hypothetical protein
MELRGVNCQIHGSTVIAVQPTGYLFLRGPGARLIVRSSNWLSAIHGIQLVEMRCSLV